jgi:hypothetical protein
MSIRPPSTPRRSRRDSAPALVAVTTAVGAVRAASQQEPWDAGSSGPVVGSVCTGYGGLDLGVLAALGGGRVAWCADPDPHIAQILATRLPGVPNLGDLRAIDWTSIEPVEVLTAGFPCQDISAAGRRAGIEKGARSGLWTDIVAGVRLLRPALLSLYLSTLIMDRVSEFADASHAEAEAVLLGFFVVELDRIAGFQGAEAIHLDRAEVDPRVEALWQVERGDRSPTLLGLEELDRATRHGRSITDAHPRGNRVRSCDGGCGGSGCRHRSSRVWLVERLGCVSDAGGDESFGVLFLLPQRGQCLTESFDFAEPCALLCFGDAVGEVVLQLAQQRQSAGFGAQHGAADTGVLMGAGRAVGPVAVAVGDLAGRSVVRTRPIRPRWVRGIPRWGAPRAGCG